MSEPHQPKSAAAEIPAYEKRVTPALASLHKRTDWEPAADVTPVHLIAREDSTLDEWGLINETARKILGWIGAEGGNPAAILRRVFAVGDHMMVEPFCLLNVRENCSTPHTRLTGSGCAGSALIR